MRHAELARTVARALACGGPLKIGANASQPAERPNFVLGFSGGADSCALAWLLAHLLPDYYAQRGSPLPWADFRLVHVAHGLGPHAGPMQAFCEAFAAHWNLPLTVMPVTVERRPRTSLEAAARSARYQALAQCLGAGDCLLTAHHADDQAETVLLNLLRGSGPNGLAAMAGARPFGPGWLLRPLLEVRGETLRGLLTDSGVDWFEDPTNAQSAPTRNFLRHEILPRLEARMPGVVATLGRVASLQGAYADFVDAAATAELAATDAVIAPTRLRIDALDGVPPLLGRVMLRCWLKPLLGQFPREADLNRIEDMLHMTAAQQAPELALGDWRLRSFKGVLYALKGPVSLPPDGTWTLAKALTGEIEPAGSSSVATPSSLSSPSPCSSRYIPPATTLELPHGVLRMAAAGAAVGGASLGAPHAATPASRNVRLCADRVASVSLTVALRHGGERLRCAAGHHRAVKDLLREAGVPPWQRADWPLVFVDDTLVAVPSIAVDPRFAPARGDSSSHGSGAVDAGGHDSACDAPGRDSASIDAPSVEAASGAVTLTWTPEDVWTARGRGAYFSGNSGSGRS